MKPLRILVAAILLHAVSFAVPSESLGLRLEKAKTLEESGAVTEAAWLYESLLAETASDPGSHAGVLRALARIAGQLGDYTTAIDRAGRAAAEFRQLHDASGEASALNNLGVARLYSGAYSAAEISLRDAVSLSTSAGDREGQAEQLSNLANVYFFQARYLEALEMHGRALDLAQQPPTADWSARRRAVVLINMATVRQRLGQDMEAMDLYRRAGEQPGVLRTNEEAQLQTNLGVLYRRLGDPFKALDSYDRARALFARDPHHDGELTVVMNRGIVFALDLGKLDAAGQAFAEARRLAEARGSRREQMQAVLYGAETLYRQAKYDRAALGFEQARSEAVELGTGEEEWKALFGLGRVALRQSGDAKAAQLLDRAALKIESVREKLRLASLKSDFFADRRDVYDALIAVHLKHPQPSEIFAYMERSRARTLQDRLRVPGGFRLDALQSSLDRRSAVLEFWVSRRGAAVLSIDRSAARIYPIAIDVSEIQHLQDALASGDDWLSAAQAVASRILPSGIVPPGVKNLVVVPDGALASIPFEVLPYSGTPLIERVSVSYLPAALLLARPASPSKQILWPWSRAFVGFADPVFATEALPGPGSTAALGSSRAEVQAIAATLTGRSRLFLGAADRRQAFLSPETAASPVLHLATHATADSENPERSRILFSAAENGQGAADYLFLKQVYDLHLAAVDLVTLSACETENGKFVPGEGVRSFSHAFLAAGAQSVLATLWRVADAPTAGFMKIFYTELRHGTGKAESLRRAKLQFAASHPSYAHPRYWAAFVISGDAASPIPRALSWWWLAAAALLLFLPLAFFYFVRATRQ